jgi:mono/diheme cytochrome c family protein
MKRTVLLFSILLIITASVTAQVDYTTQVQPIFNSRCISCHGGTSGVTLTDYASTMGSIGTQYGGPIVVPTDTTNSPLWDKINPNPIHGNRMPVQGSLSTDQLSIIATWILEGALPLTAVDVYTVSPSGFRLVSCYPNPFNPSTVVRIVNQSFAQINLTVYDVNGRIVHKFTGEYEAGYHDIPIHLVNQPSGMYVVLMQTVAREHPVSSQTQKMILMK